MAAPSSSSPTIPPASHSFESLLSEALSRRDFVRAGLGSAAVGFFPRDVAAQVPETLPFASVPISAEDRVVVPNGYDKQVLFAWGDPIDGQGPRFKSDATNTAAEQEQQAGMGHDGMLWFPWPGDAPDRSDRGLLVMNHEYTDQGLLFPDGLKNMTAEKVSKSQAAHGISVIAVERREDGVWQVVPSPWSRRITARTPMALTGPALGSCFVKTKADPEGKTVLGTINNCASGQTPWGTYLACEENVNGYFGTEAPDFKLDDQTDPNHDLRRYGFTPTGFVADKGTKKETPLYRWWQHDERFDLAKHPEEANRFGYVVEIDPADPKATPRKHTALGRLKHENAAVTLSKDQRVVVYMGDDEKNEYIYKFVSAGTYDPANRTANLDLLTKGTLYAARFQAEGKGEWIALKLGERGLTKENGFPDEAAICVRTRQAADRVGATMMDRPEWIAVHPETGEVFVTLTNNSNRAEKPKEGSPSANSPDGKTTASSAMPKPDPANPRPNNTFGHIIRWTEEGGDAAALSFAWEIFLLAGDSSEDGAVNIEGDLFGSPDGLTFDPRGILWIQTDVSTGKLYTDEYKNLGNNMMLAANPATGHVRRFLTGPRGCEITGLAFTPDLKTMFVNIQHPGEPASEASNPDDPKAVSSWPEGDAGDRPRPATVAVYRKDGKQVGT